MSVQNTYTQAFILAINIKFMRIYAKLNINQSTYLTYDSHVSWSFQPPYVWQLLNSHTKVGRVQKPKTCPKILHNLEFTTYVHLIEGFKKFMTARLFQISTKI